MKNLAWWLGALVFVAPTSRAEENYFATGIVNNLQSDESSGEDRFSIAGVKSLGSCKADKAGNVVFLVPPGRESRRIFDLAVASHTSGARLQISVDDRTTGVSGFCVIRDAQLK
ncbi:MAG TPA: hypothetical protein VGM15_13095 [Burkholderiaceae bacterium]|jgi:hypothetical protein